MKRLAGVVTTTAIVVVALVGCGGGGSAGSTESKAEQDKISLEEWTYAEEHKNNYSACVFVRGVRRENAGRGALTRPDREALRSAAKVCHNWKRERLEKDQP